MREDGTHCIYVSCWCILRARRGALSLTACACVMCAFVCLLRCGEKDETRRARAARVSVVLLGEAILLQPRDCVSTSERREVVVVDCAISDALTRCSKCSVKALSHTRKRGSNDRVASFKNIVLVL